MLATISVIFSLLTFPQPDEELVRQVSKEVYEKISRCWAMTAKENNPNKYVARDGSPATVKVRMLISEDGTVRDVGLNPSQVTFYQSDRFFRVAAENAIRAVRKCSPLQDMPADTYDIWKDIEINFHLKDKL